MHNRHPLLSHVKDDAEPSLAGHHLFVSLRAPAKAITSFIERMPCRIARCRLSS